MGEDCIDARHDVLSIDLDRAIGAVAEGDVQNGTVFRDVDFVAAEHAVTPVFNLGMLGQVKQEAQGFLGDPVLGIVEQDIAEVEGKFLEAFRISGEQVPHMS